MKCPFTVEEIKQQCREFKQKNPSGPRSFALKHRNGQDSDYVVKRAYAFGVPALQQEHGRLEHLSNNVTLDKVVTPKACGPLIQDGASYYLVFQKLPGTTLSQVMDSNGGLLSDTLADAVADAVMELRNKVTFLENRKVTPHGRWIISGHLFPDDCTSIIVDTVDELADFLKTRFQRAAEMEAELPPLTDIVFSLGDISARDIELLPDGRISFLYFGMSCFAPAWWEWYSFMTTFNQAAFADPLRLAFEKKPAIFGEDLDDIMDALCSWYTKFGSSYDLRAECRIHFADILPPLDFDLLTDSSTIHNKPARELEEL